MGWTTCYHWNTPTDIKREILADYAKSEHVEVLDHKSTCYGKHWWVALRNKKTGTSFICLFKMERFQQDDCWGYKDIDEAMGPNETDCPISLLDRTTEPTEGFAVDWRACVRKAAERRSQKFEVGDKVLCHGREYKVTGKRGRSYILDYRWKAGAAKLHPVSA